MSIHPQLKVVSNKFSIYSFFEKKEKKEKKEKEKKTAVPTF